MNLSEEKNKIIQMIQDIFYEHIRLQEDKINQEFHHGMDMKDLLETIRNQESIITNHLKTIQGQEKQIAEKDTEGTTMIKMQSDEITNKDKEIERLNKIILKIKTKDVSGGWSPTKNLHPKGPTVIDLILSSVGETIQKLDPDFKEEVSHPQTIVSRNTKYMIIPDDDQNIVYSIQGDKGIGSRVGVWCLTKTGKRKVIMDK